MAYKKEKKLTSENRIFVTGAFYLFYGVYKTLTGVVNKCFPVPYSLSLVGQLYRFVMYM
jgi:hypothetical protein